MIFGFSAQFLNLSQIDHLPYTLIPWALQRRRKKFLINHKYDLFLPHALFEILGYIILLPIT